MCCQSAIRVPYKLQNCVMNSLLLASLLAPRFKKLLTPLSYGTQNYVNSTFDCLLRIFVNSNWFFLQWKLKIPILHWNWKILNFLAYRLFVLIEEKGFILFKNSVYWILCSNKKIWQIQIFLLTLLDKFSGSRYWIGLFRLDVLEKV